jgi:surface-anchored protein
MNVKDDTRLYTPGVQIRDPAGVTVFVDSALSALDTTSLPATYNFLKVDGPTIYLLPQTQDYNLPWPGWSTERLLGTLPAEHALPTSGTPVRFDVSIVGPGNVFTWFTGSFGGVSNKYIDTVDPAADFIPVSRSAHVHTNWAFTQQGDYFITVTPSATTTTGSTITGPGVVYHIHVGPASDAAPDALVAPEVVGTGIVGQALSIDDGYWLPLPHRFSYQWLRDGQPIAGATGASYTPVSGDAGRLISAQVTAAVGAGTTTKTTASLEVSEGTQ